MEVHHTKQRVRRQVWGVRGVERGVRQLLADKVSGTMVGLWLLVPEHLRLGTWELLCGWTGKPTDALEPRLAMQLVHEAVSCSTGLRDQRSLNQRGFELANGLPFVATDGQMHDLLNAHTVQQARELQIVLGKIRWVSGHFRGKVLAFDPHRMVSYSKRRMRLRKANARAPATKTSQTFFCLDADTGQPVGFTSGTSARTVVQATPDLLALTSEILPCHKLRPLGLADSEHFTAQLLDHVRQDTPFDLLVPMPKKKHLQKKLRAIEPDRFTRRWAGLATTKIPYDLVHTRSGPFWMMVQRFGEISDQYEFNSFLCTANRDEVETLTLEYPKRWHIEEFFNMYQKIGWKRAGTQNLHIRYGQMTMALIAQAAIHQLRDRLDEDSGGWDAAHLSKNLFRGLDGDIRVCDDRIVVTYYNAPHTEHYRRCFENMPERLTREGIDPRIPWLYDFKLDFRFK